MSTKPPFIAPVREGVNSPARVYVDTCVFQLGFPFQPTEQVKTINWGGHEVRFHPPAYENKVFDGEFLQREVSLLPRVAAASRGGKVALFWSDLARLELLGAPGSSFPHREGHVFADCSFEKIEVPFLHNVALGPGFRTTKLQLEAAFKSFPDPQLQSLVSMLGESRLLDAVHLVTAARNQIDFMLTADRKLIDSYRTTTHPLSVSPVLPSELLRGLGEQP